MNQRIRYTKNTDGTYVSTKYYRSENGKEYIAGYSQEDDHCTGYVLNIAENTSTNLRATSPHKIKIAIKRELERLGCSFSAETRGKKQNED